MRLNVLLSLLVLGLLSCTVSPGPRAQGGFLDLSAHQWNSGTVDLGGEWTFDGAPQQVPASLHFGGTAYGSGTYRLTVRVPAGSPELALRLPITGTAFELSVNGVALAHEGTVANQKAGSLPSYRPRIVPLPPSQTLELSLRVSNWDDQFAGLYNVPVLGPRTVIEGQRETAVVWEALVFGALFVLGLYHTGSFFFRTKNRAPLWFGVFCILVALRSTMYSELLVLVAFPDASWYLVIRGVYATMSLALVALMELLEALYPRQSWRPGTVAAVVIGLAYALVNLVAPVDWTTGLLVPFQVAMVAAGLYAVVTVARAVADKEPGAVLFVAGTAVFVATIALDIVKNHFFWAIPSLVNVGTLGFLLAQSLVVAKLFANAIVVAENHSKAMDKVNTSLERFIPREVLGFLGKANITEIDLGDFSEQRMTVFFLDIRDFTTLSEAMTPRENFRFINSFLRQFGPLVRNHNGFVDKYLGDGIMALFPGTPDEALNAAVAMRLALVEYNQGRVRGGYPSVRFGIGVHTGPLMLGTIGENRRMDSTVISDTVNAASRLEGLTKKYSVDILLSGETLADLRSPGAYPTEFVAQETVKGRRRPMDVYRIL